jgi:CubicO group peptidase (beta-lactamase class C family)
MKTPKILGISAIVLFATVAWVFWPIYGFYAHRGEAPLPPWGWTALPAETPSMQVVLDDQYAVAGSKILPAMTEHRRKIGAPAMTAAVAVDGEVVWQGAVGWADIETQQPAAPTTIFPVGSTSKAITSTALARLVDKRQIDLDTPISNYLSELPNPTWATITPRMLSSHMAGLPHYGDNQDLLGYYQTGALRRNYPDVRDALSVFDGSHMLFKPGTDFEYSSFGTVLLGAVMSDAAGKSYRQIITDEVIAPGDMTATVVAPRHPGTKNDHATPYFVDGQRYRPWRAVDLSHRLPGGGWASTSTVLVRMGMMWLDESIISGETRAAFWTPQTLSSGEINEQGYAIGWRWREYDVDCVGLARNANHGGVSRGAQSWLLIFPDYDMAIAFNINSNTEEFGEFASFYEEIFREFALASDPITQEERRGLN